MINNWKKVGNGNSYKGYIIFPKASKQKDLVRRYSIHTKNNKNNGNESNVSEGSWWNPLTWVGIM